MRWMDGWMAELMNFVCEGWLCVWAWGRGVVVGRPSVVLRGILWGGASINRLIHRPMHTTSTHRFPPSPPFAHDRHQERAAAAAGGDQGGDGEAAGRDQAPPAEPEALKKEGRGKLGFGLGMDGGEG